jgi:hypothetical protein
MRFGILDAGETSQILNTDWICTDSTNYSRNKLWVRSPRTKLYYEFYSWRKPSFAFIQISSNIRTASFVLRVYLDFRHYILLTSRCPPQYDHCQWTPVCSSHWYSCLVTILIFHPYSQWL